MGVAQVYRVTFLKRERRNNYEKHISGLLGARAAPNRHGRSVFTAVIIPHLQKHAMAQYLGWGAVAPLFIAASFQREAGRNSANTQGLEIGMRTSREVLCDFSHNFSTVD